MGAAGAARTPGMLRADRHLRETVKRYGGCLDVLTTRQERVLRLRAGVGAAAPASRGRVAQRLGLSVPQVRRVERRGMRALERAGRHGCPAVAPSAVEEQAYAVGGALGTVLAGGTLPGARDATSPGDANADQAAGGTAGGDEGEKAGGDTVGASSEGGGVTGITATRPAPEQAGTEITGPLLLVLLLAIAGLAIWGVRRSAGDERTADV